MGKAARAQAARGRAREVRLDAARDRRLRMNPDRLERERRIDEAVVDVELAWEGRGVAEQAVGEAERAAAAALRRLFDERLSLDEVVQLVGLERGTVRRLRQVTDVPSTSARPPETASS